MLSNTNSEAHCRICYSSSGNLYSFCECRGSIGCFHRKCLQRWIRVTWKDELSSSKVSWSSGSERNCEICLEKFKGVVKKLKPVRRWKLPSISSIDPVNLSMAMFCTILVIYSLVIFIRNSDRIVQNNKIPMMIFGLSGINAMVFIFAISTWNKILRKLWRKFFELNRTWYVVVSKDMKPFIADGNEANLTCNR